MHMQIEQSNCFIEMTRDPGLCGQLEFAFEMRNEQPMSDV